MPSRNGETYESIEYPFSIVSLEGSLGTLELFDLGTETWGVRKIYKEQGESAKWRLALFLMSLRTLTEARDRRTKYSNVDWGVDFDGARFSNNLFRAGEDLSNSPRQQQ